MTPGTRIGRYELVTLLGRGGMGEVWAATLLGPRGFRKPVAVKLLRPGVVGERDVEALVREARLGAGLAHPGVVAIHDLAQVDGRWLVAMERVFGPTLDELGRGGPLPARAVVEVGIQVCVALDHIHGAGLVHRDLKPSNLLVDRSGLVKVGDLGIAMLAGSPGGATGTPGYCSPEQIGGFTEARSDLFSVGVTLGKLLTGQRPFGRGPRAIAAVVRAEHSLRQSGWLATAEAAAPGLGQVLERCLRTRLEDRWDDATSLGHALQALLPSMPGAGLHTVLQRALPDSRRGGPLKVATPSPAPTRTPPTLVARIGNLPAVQDSFVGRALERAQLLEAVRDGARLLTLLGPGGAGKTRLALEAGRVLDAELPGGAWFVDLSEAVTADGVLNLVGRALDVAAGQLGPALAERSRMVLILDNLEQVVGPAAPLVDGWRTVAPDLTIIVTSRIALRLRGEQTLPVGPLTPDDGVDLFQARSHRPVGEADRPAVRALVEALDGLPLAIELAAARTRVLTLPQIRQRLEDRFRLLAGGGGERPARHRSLRASLDASWELLTPCERTALAQLSVLVGAFDLDAVEHVVDLSEHEEPPWPVDVLASLVDQSLVVVTEGRLKLLVSVQAYAAEQLTRAERALAEARHGRYFARQVAANQRRRALNGPNGPAVFAELAADLENLVVACFRAADRGDPDVAEATALAAAEVLERTGPLPLAVEVLSRALSTRGGDEHTVVLRRRGYLLQCSGDIEGARADYEGAFARASQRGERLLEGILSSDLGVLARLRADEGQAEARMARALEIFQELGDRRLEAGVHSVVGHWRLNTGALVEARARFEAALEGFRKVGDQRFVAEAMNNLGSLAWAEGRLEEAARCYAEALEGMRRVSSRRSEGLLLGNLAVILAAQGRMPEARAHYEAALDIHLQTGDTWRASDVLRNLGNLHLGQGRLEQARSCYDQALPTVRGEPLSEGLLHGALGQWHTCMGDPAAARASYEQAIALHTEVGDAYGLAHWRNGLASLDLEAGDVGAALRNARDALAAAGDYADAVAAVSATLVRALVAAGEVGGAHEVLEATRGRTQDVGVQVHLRCARAVVLAAEGDAEGAAEALDTAISEARFLGAGPGSPIARAIAAAGHAQSGNTTSRSG